METPSELTERIRDASHYVPLERLGLVVEPARSSAWERAEGSVRQLAQTWAQAEELSRPLSRAEGTSSCCPGPGSTSCFVDPSLSAREAVKEPHMPSRQ